MKKIIGCALGILFLCTSAWAAVTDVGIVTIDNDVTISSDGSFTMSGGDVVIKGNLDNNGALMFRGGLKGFGTLEVTGSYSGNGTTKIGVPGIGLFNAANDIPLMSYGSGSVTFPTDGLTTTQTNGNSITATFNSDSKKADLTLGKKVSALDSVMGWSEIKPDENEEGNPVVVTLELTGNTNPTDFLTKFNESFTVITETLATAAYVGDSTSLVSMLLNPELLEEASVFAWNFTDYGDNVKLSSVDSRYVPEPATWAILALGAFGLFYLRKRR